MLELAEQVVERLLADPEPGGELGGPLALWAGVLEDDQIGGVEVGEARSCRRSSMCSLHRLPGEAQERADHWRPERLWEVSTIS